MRAAALLTLLCIATYGALADDAGTQSLPRVFDVATDGPVSVVALRQQDLAVQVGDVVHALGWSADDSAGPRTTGRLLQSPDERLPVGALPDGVIARSHGLSAYLTGPTERYRHGVLGDAVEAVGLSVELAGGPTLRRTLPEDSVFEDRFPRLADIDGDGQDDIVVVRSYLDAGAAVSVWTVNDGEIVSLGESRPIGRPNRWLNPAGIADFDGDGRVEIAAVITPHIGGILKLYELRDGRLVEEAAEPGFSNHEIGSRVLGMSAVVVGHPDGPVLALPDLRRSTLRIVAFHGGRFAEWHRIPHESAIATDIVAHDLNADGRDELIYALKGGRLVVVDGAGIGVE